MQTRLYRPNAAGGFFDRRSGEISTGVNLIAPSLPLQKPTAGPLNNNLHRAQIKRAVLMTLWTVLTGCVVVGSLLPAGSPVMVAVGRMHVSDNLLHFCAYLTLSCLPAIGFRDRRGGIVAGVSMFVLGIVMEAGQYFAPGRTVELGDVIASGAGVSCGTLLGLPIRACVALL